ncbi:MAG: transketolase [Chloroflexota bacterium]
MASTIANQSTLDSTLEEKAVNTIRLLSADAVQQAKSGHPGMPMGMAQAAFTLWTRYLRHSPSHPSWSNRDRFILSAGHGSMLLYSLLHLTGYDVSLDELRNFRQWGSLTPGHPEHGHTPGVDTTTGPLGQGFTNGVGMAIAERWLAERFNKPDFPVMDHYVYAICSDGDLMEGISSEAASLAGHLKLGKLIYLYDDNNITIEGSTDLAYSEDWAKRFEAYGWHVQSIDGMDGTAVATAIEAAQNDSRPSIIGCKTIIGFGSPNHQGTAKVHGEPLGDEELAVTRAHLGFPADEKFHVPDEVSSFYRQAIPNGKALESTYSDLLEAYSEKYPDEAAELNVMLSGQLPDGWEEALPNFDAGSSMASRNSGGEVINAIAQVIPNFVGGSADLAGSNKTNMRGIGSIQADSWDGRNMHFGVREHAMGGILNGMALHGGVVPYGGTFLIFSDYMRGSMRLAALMGLRVVYVLTHDGIGVGEDGPTHQPIEQVASLRAIPNMTLFRPADGNEVTEAWRAALRNEAGPTALALTRQNLTTVDRTAPGYRSAEGAAKGGYILYESSDEGPQVALLATGSEVEICCNAAKILVAQGIRVRVVSIPSWELFSAQDEGYRDEVLPHTLPKVAVEAGTSLGWERWVGNDKSKGLIIALDHFGASAPFAKLYQEFGLTPDNVAEKAKGLVN